MKDFSLYPLLLPQLASDALQNIPFCSGERDQQGHTIPAAATPSPRQLCLASSHPLPSLLLIQKVRFVGKNCIFLVPGPTSTRYTETSPFGFSRFQPAVLHKSKKVLLYMVLIFCTGQSLASYTFCTGNLGPILFLIKMQSCPRESLKTQRFNFPWYR